MFVLGRREAGSSGAPSSDGPSNSGPSVDGLAGSLGHYRARDGSVGAAVAIDFDRPHATCVVGQRGSGKSYTLGVLAEGLADATGVTPLVLDPMGAFGTLGTSTGGFHVVEPLVRASSLPPPAWPRLLGLDPGGGPGSLVWRAASERDSLDGIRAFVEASDAPEDTRRAAANHLRLAASWGVFSADAPDVRALLAGPTVVSLSGLDTAPANAVVRAVASACYRARLHDRVATLPWLLIDEAHVFFDGVARPALERLLTRGRMPGVSFVCATQRPTALPDVAVSQSDLLLAHRLTTAADRAAVRAARPDGGGETLAGRWPRSPGEALVFDDATGSVHAVQVRERRTVHGGESPRASGGGRSPVAAPRPGPDRVQR